MVIIKFKNGNDWFKANWAFRQIANDVIAQSPEDKEIRLTMEKAQAFGALDLISMEKGLAAKILDVLGKAVEKTLEEGLPGWKKTRPDDADGYSKYREALEELLILVRLEANN